MQANPHKTISRNFAGQKGVACYIQSAERKKMKFQLGILLSAKVVIKN